MSDLTAKEQKAVRTALKVLRLRVGTWAPLAKALRYEWDSIQKVATGFVLPNPFELTLSRMTHWSTRKSRTVPARFSERVWLKSSLPTLSVCPST